ncbi:protein TonB [Rhodopseudomonas rhenobacensis]|uniref:Protein TonB n=1 Tax=Rhodopseudomonas rhenobacensis TaxID=87461 RepID=A0A7W8E002_9BRAD|nr:energy transducer TonB [Rhodopseudomonas rhenobacensis]MBB5048377.1 protein TonB [Rhodopseudomonas rhenobacensis]
MAEASELNAFTLHTAEDRSGLRRWALSALVVVALHVGLIAAAIAWYTASPPPGAIIPAIMVDMAPSSAAPQLQPLDLPPGPQMQEAEAPPPPPPEPEPVAPPPPEQALPPTPVQEKPDVAAPQEPKAEPAPPKPAPTQIVREQPQREPKKPKREPRVAKKPAETPAPQTSAPPAAARQARAAAAATAGAAAAAALPSYRDRLAAHLQRFKQYPSEARSAGVQGTAMLSFTVGRGGQVLGARLARSSGSASLDAETMAMIRRAQPLPAFPPEMPQRSLSFTVPVRFSIR